MGKVTKSQKCDKGRCKKHIFQLKPLQKGLYFKKVQRVKFCPKFNQEIKKFDDIMPTINKDQKIYTPLFILEDEQKNNPQHQEKYRQNYENKLKQCLSKNQIFIARPARKRQYCSICRTNYAGYLQHLDQQQHKKLIKKSKYNGFIKQIEQYFKTTNTIIVAGENEDEDSLIEINKIQQTKETS